MILTLLFNTSLSVLILFHLLSMQIYCYLSQIKEALFVICVSLVTMTNVMDYCFRYLKKDIFLNNYLRKKKAIGQTSVK